MKPLLHEDEDEKSTGSADHQERRFWSAGRICLALVISLLLCLLTVRPWKWDLTWDRTIRTAWGLVDEAPVRTNLKGPMDGHYLTTIQAAVTSQAETYQRTMGPKSDHFVNVLAITGGEHTSLNGDKVLLRG